MGGLGCNQSYGYGQTPHPYIYSPIHTFIQIQVQTHFCHLIFPLQ